MKKLELALRVTCGVLACSAFAGCEDQTGDDGMSNAGAGAGAAATGGGASGTGAGANAAGSGAQAGGGASGTGAGANAAGSGVQAGGGASGTGAGAQAGAGGTAAGSGASGAGGGSTADDDAGVDDAGGIGADAGDAGAVDTGPEPCAGKPGALRGKSRQTMMLGGIERWFNYYAPEGLDPNKPVPLVIVPHGFYMDGDIMYDVTQYADLADEEQFVVAFPSGAGPTALDPPWNIGTPTPECIATVGFLPMTENDDQAFMDEIIDFVEADQCLDRDHVFMTGFSMGAYFTNTTGCNNSAIKAIAPHSGGSHDLSGCPETKKPVLLMHFEQDELIPYDCGTESRDRWVALNGCQIADPEIRMVNGGSCEYYQGCQDGGQVAMCTFQAPATGDELFVGHAWSGGYEPQPVVLSGYSIPETESATRLSWEFFKEFAW